MRKASSSSFSIVTVPISMTGVTRTVPHRHITYRALRKWQTSRAQWPSNSQLESEADEGRQVISVYGPKFGRNIELNWGLHKYRIAPANDAYRNLHLGGLLMHANGTIDAKKALHVPLNDGADDFAVYYGEKAPSFTKDAQVVALQQYKEIVRQIKEHLCDVPNLYVHDGAIGSHNHCETRIRAITDSPVIGIYLHHLLSKVQLGAVQEFEHALTAYFVPDFQLEDPKSVGMKASSFVLLDVPRGIAFVVGTSSTNAVRTALTSIAAPRVFVDREAVPLNANIVHIPNQPKPLLVINPDNSLLKTGLKLDLGGGHNVAWGSKGIYRFFDGVSYPHHKALELKKGDLVEKDGKGTLLRATTRGSGQNAYQHPAGIVLVVSDASGVLPVVSKVSANHIKDFFLGGPTGAKETPFKPLFADNVSVDPKGVSEKIAQLAKDNQVDVHIVNVQAKGTALTNDELSEILTSIGQGSAANASGLSDVFSNLLPLTSLKGVKANLDPTKRGWSAADYKKAAANFEQSLQKFVSTNFPQQQQQQQQQQQ